MTEQILPYVTAFILSVIAIQVFNPLAVKLGLVDRPCHRKRHTGAIPLIGGLAIYSAVACSSLCFLPMETSLLVYLASSALIVLVGALDDYRHLSVKMRLGFQVLVALLMIYAGGNSVHSLGNLFGLGDIELGIFSMPFTVIAAVGVMNAFNMIDGIDGLLGGLTLVALGSLLFLSIGKATESEFSLLLIFAIALIPYLFFNLRKTPKYKIFMGDSGSMFIGFSLAWMLIDFSQQPNPIFSPASALWIIALPLIDMAVTMLRRMQKGRSPFKADRTHFHHILLRAGFSSRQCLALIVALAVTINAMLCSFNVFSIDETLIFLGFLSLFFIAWYVVMHGWKMVRAVRRFTKSKP